MNTKDSLAVALKYVQEKLVDLVPKSAIVYERTKMPEASAVGRELRVPVMLKRELGFTFGDGTGFTYNDDLAGKYGEVTVDPNPVVLKSRMGIELADRLARSGKALTDEVMLRAGAMKESLIDMAEIEILYGRSGVGVVSGAPSITTESGSNDSAVVTITAATWAAGIWAGKADADTGAALEVRSTGGTKRNSTGNLTLISVDHDNHTITVRGADADVAAITDTDIIYFAGAYSNGQYGLQYQMSYAGSVFGISNTTYDLWNAQTLDCGSAALTMEKVLKGRAKCLTRGGLDEDTVLLCSVGAFENLNADLSLKSEPTSGARRGEDGFEGLVVHGQGGKVEIVAHPKMKDGMAMLLPMSAVRKIGSKDVTFAGADGETAEWKRLEDAHAYQLTARYSFQILLDEPAKACLFTGIVNS